MGVAVSVRMAGPIAVIMVVGLAMSTMVVIVVAVNARILSVPIVHPPGVP